MRTGADDPAGEEAVADARLLAAAESVAEGGEVDWARRAADAPELAGALAELQGLARLGEAMRPHERPSPGRVPLFRWGDLEVLGPLGEGSSGEVLRAWDPALEREVALKLAPAGAAPSQPLEEARRLARLRHANVVSVLGVDVHDGRAGLWMELVEGRTLEQVLSEHGAFGAREAAGIGLELCRALAAVHRAGFLHGDVSPRNVMRERGGRIVLMDLGSAVVPGSDGLAIVTGTPLITAPEVVAGGEPTVAADLYSLGCLLFRLVTGRYPVEAATLDELRAAHAMGVPERLRSLRPDLPAEFVRVVEHALRADPSARPADAAAFEQALAESLASGLREPAPAAESPRRALPRSLRPMALASAGALLALLLTSQWLGRERPNRPAAQAPPGSGARAGADPAPAAPRPAPPQLEVAAFVRTRAGVSERVESGALVRVGDELALEVRAAEPLHVYVLNEDDAGAVFALFPVSGTDVSNPLPKGRTIGLPGARAGREMHWQVSSPARRERFLVVASRAPIPALAERLAAMPQAREGEPLAYAEIRPSDLDRMRGVGRLEPASPSRRALGALDRMADALSGDGQVWLRTLELVHESR